MGKNYTETGFWNKVKGSAKAIGKELLEDSFILYYALVDKDTPVWAKSTITGALAYLISPVDAIPDVLPGGYVDDAAVIAGAIIAVGAHIKDEHKRKAKKQAARLL